MAAMAGLTLGILGVCSPAQHWSVAPSAAAPEGRVLHAIAYDLQTTEVLLFGGMLLGVQANGDTWVWNGAGWQQRQLVIAPSPRWGHAMASDPQRRRILLFGGAAAFGSALGDTWEWDGATWQAHQPVHTPNARGGAAMAWHAGTSQIVLFGGANNTLCGDTWTWNGLDWALAAPANAPTPRHAHAMAFDALRDRIVLVGGLDPSECDDTHEWDGATWHPIAATGPGPRYHPALAFDGVDRRVVLFGGNHNGQILADTWAFDGSVWATVPDASPPTARYQAAMVFDAERQHIVLFGGGDGATNLFDTWRHTAPSSAPIATAVPFGSGCGNPPLQLNALVGSRPVLGTTVAIEVAGTSAAPTFVAIGLSSVRIGGLPLPLALDDFGMLDCRLYGDGALGLAQPTLPTGPGTAILGLRLPSAPHLIGLRLTTQGWAAVAGHNPGGLIVSNGLELVLGSQ